MKQAISVILLITLTLTLCACGSHSISLDAVQKMSQENLEQKLTGLSQEKIHEMWGEPDSFLSELWGDIYLLPDDDMMIIICYETDISKANHGHVVSVKITQRQIK